ncbi:MAG TPA: nucleotide sugar dehydrogenase [Anaerolineales bacterium]|nr:nucleotide sugar dehydrogenase [Anaerolineales bacterium]
MEFRSLCVLGLGYIGLPTASTFATHGLEVVGVDVNRRIVDVLRNGEVHIQEPGLRTLVQAAFRSGRLRVSDRPEPADAFIIAVPTPIAPPAVPSATPSAPQGPSAGAARADLSYVRAAAESIVPHLRQGNLVVLESTSPPRTTVDVVAPILERSGLRIGPDVHLAYSPERVLPGQILRELVENARVIGGIDDASAGAGRDLYAAFVKGEIILTDATTAEFVKLMENTFRDVNIALANEFSRLAERFGVDVWEAIDLANRHPRVSVLRPGPGVGGHCISVDPWFLVEAAPDLSPLIRQARQVNDGQPGWLVDGIEKALGGLRGRTIAALGLAYKQDVDDLRESPAIAVVRELAARGARVRTYEPNAPAASVEGAEAAPSLERALDGAEAFVLLVDHRPFRALDPALAARHMAGRIAFDARGVLPRAAWREAGFAVHVLGAGGGHA